MLNNASLTAVFLLYGYDIDKNKNYVINENEAKIVKEMFDLYEAGNSLIEITNIFNKKGYKTKRGTEFKKNSLYDMIGNERYAGYYIYSKSKNHNKRVERDDIIKIEDGIPAIISKERMKKILEKRRKNKTTSFNSKEEYLLSDLIYCGECGEKYYGKMSTKNNKNGTKIKNLYYRCKCEHNRTLKKEYIEEIVLKCIKENIVNSKELKELTKRINDIYKERTSNKNDIIKDLKNELKEVNKKMDNITQAVMNGLYNSNMKEMSNKLENRKNEILYIISETEKQNDENTIAEKDIKKILENDLKNFDKLNIIKRRAIIQKWVKKIRVMDKQIIITLNLLGTDEKSFVHVAPRVGLEPTTLRLTAVCSTD